MSGHAGLEIRDSSQAALLCQGCPWRSRGRALLTTRGLLVLSLIVNAPLVVWYIRRLAGETDTYLFLTGYYWQGWSALWEPLWVPGSSLPSYPALIHQLIPLLAYPISAVIAFFVPGPNLSLGYVQSGAVELALGALLLCIAVAFPFALQSYLRLFLAEQAAGLAGLAAVCLMALGLVALSVEQLTTVAGLATVLLSLAAGSAFTRAGDRWALVEAIALAGAAGALYHGAWLPVALAVVAVIGRDIAQVVQGRRSVLPYLGRLLLWAGLATLALALVASPAVAPLVNRLDSRWWGIERVVIVFVAVVAGTYRRARARHWPALPVIAGLRRTLWTLAAVFLTLPFWAHNWPAPTPSGVRTTPLPIPLYASDVLLAATFIVWCVERLLRRRPLVLGSRLVAGFGALVILAAAVSIPSSLDPAQSLALTAHLILLASFYLLCVNDPPAPAHLGRLFASLLVFEAVFGLLQAWMQNTFALRWLYMSQISPLTAAQSGASIVGAADGAPWLRAYGTLVHPNVLGGILLIYLGAVVERHLATGRRLWLFVILVGVVVLFLSFSRSAWVGMLAAAVVLAMTLAPASTRRLRWVFASVGVTFALMALAFWPIVQARIGAAPVPVDPEVRSTTERLVLLRVGFAAIQERPLFGLGAGTFTEWVARLPGRPAPIAPIHNVPLLVVAETGLAGIAAWLVLSISLAHRVWRGWRRLASWDAVWTSVLIGVLVTSMADHYWWTRAPMRTMFVIALALFTAPPFDICSGSSRRL